MKEKNLTEDSICVQTGLHKKSLQRIMDNGYISEDALERIAGAAGVNVKEIYLPDSCAFDDNVIEFIKNSDRATVTFSQERFKSRIKNLTVERPEECQIVAENADGTICAHIPVSWIKINPTYQLSEEQREERAQAMRRNLLKSRL